MSIKVSVVIVSYNVQDFLDLCLDAVTKSLKNIEHEIFVVDNDSKDDSVGLVQRKYPHVRLIDNKINVGFSKANNQALALSSGEYIHYLNPDTIIPEDFYEKCLAYMDAHPHVGALGPRIIDADGNYAPDSKKSFPSFWVSVAKVAGLSKAFPKSKWFNKYYAAHVGEYETAPVDILSGCCLLVNKENLMQSGGGFDEAYFMYCEDVDMCHRLNLHGYKNIYFPEVTIVHYKGESTRKLTFSYMKIFYEAHALFVEKYYPKKLGILFNWALKTVLMLRNVFTVLKYIFSILKIYLLDALIIVGSLLLFRYYWFSYIHQQSIESVNFLKVIPIFLAVWMASLFLNGAYDKPYSLFKTGRGMVWGTIFVLAVYGMFPLELRHSRAVVFFSGVLSTVALLLMRTFFAYLGVIKIVPRGKNDFKSVIASAQEDYEPIKKRLLNNQYRLNIVGRIGVPQVGGREEEQYLGTTNDFKEIQPILSVNEVVFVANSISYHQILDTMQLVKDKCTYKIIPSNSEYIIHSQSIKNDMELYGLTSYRIDSASNRRNKWLLDMFLAIGVLLTTPLWLLINKSSIIKSAFKVMMQKYSWVGYSPINQSNNDFLPTIKPGIFPPYLIKKPTQVSNDVLLRIDEKYAREYSVLDDLQYFLKNVRFL